jgi:hypothetical protein
LVETNNWIKGKLEYNFYLATNDNQYIYLNYHQKLHFDYKKKILTITFQGIDKEIRYRKIEIPISKLNPNGFIIKKIYYEENNIRDARVEYELQFQCRNEERLIKCYTKNGPTNEDSLIYIRIPGAVFDDYGPEFEKRLKKALSHFVILCGGQREVF